MDRVVRVLYIARDAASARAAAERLEGAKSQFQVKTSIGAVPALQALTNDNYDCLVSEYELPDSNGLELLEQVRNNYDKIPFILLTKYGDQSVVGDAITGGVTDCLQQAEDTSQYKRIANRISSVVATHRTVLESTEERHRFEQVLKTVPSCVVQLNRDGRFIFANDRAETVLGLEKDELVGRGYNDPEWDIKNLDGSHIPDSELPFARILHTGEPIQNIKHTIRWPNGRERVLSVSGAPIIDDTSVKSVVFSLTDITDRYRRERRLERLHRATRELHNAKTKREVAQITSDTADAILDFDLNGVHLYDERAGGLKPVAVSDRTQRVADELVTFDHGIAWEAFQSGEVRRYDDIRNANELYNPETVFRSGLYFPLGEYGVLLVNSTERSDFDEADVSLGQLLAETVKSALDRVKREQRLASLQERTSALMQTTNVIETVDIAVDATTDILGTNLSGFFQKNENEAVLQPLSTTDPIAEKIDKNSTFQLDAGADRVMAFLSEVYDSGKPKYVSDTADHSRLPADLSVRSALLYPINDHGILAFAAEEPHAFDKTDKQLGWILASTLEIALERVNRETLLRDRTQKLSRQNKQLDEFARTITHDLRNPMQVLRGTLDGVRQTADVDHLDRGYRALERMERLIDDVLALAQEGQLIDDTETVSLESIARECWEVLETTEAELIVNGDIQFEADPGRVRQIFENLFANSVSHAGDGVTVTVDTLSNGFSVADDGPGIDPIERDQIFNHGYTSTGDGTGFGLAIVKQIADAHNWTASVTQSPSGGAQIEFTDVGVASSFQPDK
jgi:PAS domain S-box-containing protein